MTLERIVDNIIETDVLVIGGGVGGCPAAAKAAEHGLKVTLVEKSKTDRSGDAGPGMDHYSGFPRGITPAELTMFWQRSRSVWYGEGRVFDPNVTYKVCGSMFWALDEMEKLGVQMRWDDGEFYWYPGGRLGGTVRTGLRVHWHNVKPQLAAAVRKRGIKVLERTTVIDLLTNNGKVVGATVVNTRTGEFTVIKAKATVVATGAFHRCYEPETPQPWKYKFRYHWSPVGGSGDGWAVSYRAGAELTNMDLTGGEFRIRDDLTCMIGNFYLNDGIRCREFTWDGEEIPTPHATMYAELEQKGKTPLYKTLEYWPDDWHKRMEVGIVDERLISFKIAEDRGFNPRTHWYEAGRNKALNFRTCSGVNVDEGLRTSLKGLYAIGDCGAGGGGVANAATTGLMVGDSLYDFISKAEEPVVDEAQVESQKEAGLAPLRVKDGTEPMELECAVRYICENYVGQFKSEGKLREGLRRLGTLRRRFLPQLMAKNPHYLMRCLEARNIMDLAEVHINACLERKESRGDHIRLDYPKRDPSRDNWITYQRMENGKALLEIREVPELKPEYAKGEK